MVLDDQDVVPALLLDLSAQVTLPEEGIADDHLACARQQAQQFEGRLVLVGRGRDTDLRPHRLDLGGVGGAAVLARDVAVATAPQAFAIAGDVVGRWGAPRAWASGGPERRPRRAVAARLLLANSRPRTTRPRTAGRGW